MSAVDIAVARAYLELSADLALRAANIASGMHATKHGKRKAERMEAVGEEVHKLIRGALGERKQAEWRAIAGGVSTRDERGSR